MKRQFLLTTMVTLSLPMTWLMSTTPTAAPLPSISKRLSTPSSTTPTCAEA